jgi:hypothetical protein
MKKQPGIFLQIMGCLFVPDAISPFFSCRREVDVALYARSRIVHTIEINKTIPAFMCVCKPFYRGYMTVLSGQAGVAQKKQR